MRLSKKDKKSRSYSQPVIKPKRVPKGNESNEGTKKTESEEKFNLDTSLS